MSNPVFTFHDIVCPECQTTDNCRMIVKVSETQHESVIWCANGHIGYLDRHDRWTFCIDTSEHVWLAVKRRPE